MKLNKTHREAFLLRLQKARKEYSMITEIMCKDETKENVVSSYEVDSFLIQEEIELIEKSLINNDIDY